VTGLTGEEAARRLTEFGPNALTPARRLGWLREAVGSLADPMAVMLLVVGVLYLAVGEVRDGVVLLVALVPVIGVDVFLEARSRGVLRRLAAATAPRVRVLRDGSAVAIDVAAVVPGDLLVLAEGDIIAADGVVQAARNLALDESALTGESEPQTKEVGDERGAGRVFAGTHVVAGTGHAEVTATGPRTRFGAIAALVQASTPPPTPIQRRTAALVRTLAIVAVVVAVLVTVLALVRGAGWLDAILAGVSLAMAAIPEEFPLVLALFLSVGAYRLGRRGVLVRRLACIETLGSTTVICTDKTGTLTAGTFELERQVAISGGDDELLRTALLACEPGGDDPMDRAIVRHVVAHGLDPAAVTAGSELVHDYDFDPRGKHMSHVWRRADGRWTLAAKGAPEGLLEHCTGDDAARARVDAAVRELNERGMRTLGVAARDDFTATGERDADERGLRFVGLLGFRDPLRPSVPAAIAECQRAGIRVLMLTGDHALTAHAIAEQAGIVHAHPGGLVNAAELDALDEQGLQDRLRDAAIIARTRPDQKHRIVVALQAAGEVVAVTGDGINDAPALRQADIGVSMGERGTAVAQAAAGLVLLHDDFAALVVTVREGRHVFLKIQRAFAYLLAFHTPIIALALAVPLVGLPPLLLPVHLVWLELIVHPISALAFEAEPAPHDLMDRPPRPPKAPLLARGVVIRSLVTGLLITAAALTLDLALQERGAAVARTAAVTTVIGASLVLVWAERSGERAWWRVPLPRSLRFWACWLGAAASLVVTLAVPAVQGVLRLAPLTGGELALALVAGVAAVAWRAPGVRHGDEDRPGTPR